MNIMEYRAMVEAEKNQPSQTEGTVTNAQVEQGTTAPAEPVVQTPAPNEPAPSNEGTQTPTQIEPSAPQIFDVGGQQVTLDELQRGYLRQSDYTRKTQEVARQQRQIEEAQKLFETLEKNPEIAQQVGYDPQQVQMQNMQQQYFDLLLQQELNDLSTKYSDFDSNAVLNFAHENNMSNLEHAYLLNKQIAPPQVNTTPAPPQTMTAPVDVEALKAQLRAELQAEMNTSTIISSSGTAPTPQAEVQLNALEAKIASAFKMTPEAYKKWGN